MGKVKKAYPKSIKELENPYFDLQAEIGITKHMGGLKATKELAELCEMERDRKVLDVGCGVGMATCFFARYYGCRITGVDLSEKMVERAKERAKRKRLEGKVDFLVADAQDLPFDENTFDIVLSESVVSFTEDKKKTIKEYLRVTKKGGYVGFNEVVWRKEAIPEEVEQYMFKTIGGVIPETPEKWESILRELGINELSIRSYPIEFLKQWFNEVKLMDLAEYPKYIYRLIHMYLKSPAYREVIKKMAKDAKNPPKGFYTYWGYGIFVAKKPWVI